MEKESMNDVYDAALITAAAVGISMVSKKVIKEPLGMPESLSGIGKLAVAVAGGTLLIKYLQKKNMIPVDPFKPKQ